MNTKLFVDAKEELKRSGMSVDRRLPMKVSIQDARQLLWSGLCAYIEHPTWCDEYNEVASWLADNNNKGLALFGDVGRGKSVIATQILPVILHHYYAIIPTIVTAIELARDPDAVLRKRVIIVDDVGCEDITSQFGVKRIAFSELMDACERDGKLLIITSNLKQKQRLERYGQRTADRINQMLRKVQFIGDSFRGQQ